MANNFQGFVGNLNELVQDFFSNTNLSYDPAGFNSYNDKWSYIYATLIKTKGPDLIKLSNLQNYLSEWDRPYSYGGFIRSISIGPARPIDPPTFANGSTPNNHQIRKADVQATYHPLKVRVQFMQTLLSEQLKEAMSGVEEASMFLAGVMQSLTDGVNDSMYRMYKQVFYKFYSELSADMKTALTDTLPEITDKPSAIEAVNTIRNYKTSFMFGKGDFSSTGFAHTVIPERQRLYVNDAIANAMVDHLKLDHFMGDAAYADIPGSLSQFLGIPVRMLDDFGGLIPMGGDTPAQLYPKFDAEGAVTGQYSSTAGGTDTVEPTSWETPANYNIKAVLTEEDFGNAFLLTDNVLTDNYILGGGYTNTARYTERLLVAKPQCNTIYFT